MNVCRFSPPLYIEHKVFYENFTFVEADRLKKAVQVLALEDVVDVSKPGFLHDFERGIKLEGLRQKEAAVESVQVLFAISGLALMAASEACGSLAKRTGETSDRKSSSKYSAWSSHSPRTTVGVLSLDSKMLC
jgi:hypothetical protein